MAASNEETEKYEYSFDIHESAFEEDDRWEWITVKFRLWKLAEDSSGNRTSAAKMIAHRECDVHRVEIDDDYEEPIMEISARLTELGFPEPCHARMIAMLLLCINVHIIERRRYRHMTVLMDICDTSGVGVWNERFDAELRRSIEGSESSVEEMIEKNLKWPKWWLPVGSKPWGLSWPWEDNYDCLAEAVWTLRHGVSLRSQWVDVPWGYDDDFEEALIESLEEYTPQMVRASEDAIAGLKKVVQGRDVQELCNICMDEDDEEVAFSLMPCNHVFHTGCVETWLRINCCCPLCRYALPAEVVTAESKVESE